MDEPNATKRPERMFRNGRPNDQTFAGDEALYFRVLPAKAPNGKVELTQIRYPDFSVNREKYSEPEDVVWGYEGFCIAHFQVKDVPESQVPEGSNVTYDFAVVHCPNEDIGEENFAHCEVRSQKNGVFDRKLKIPNTVKSIYRQALADKTNLYENGRVF